MKISNFQGPLKKILILGSKIQAFKVEGATFMTGFCGFFCARISRNFHHIPGRFPNKIPTDNLEKKESSTGENSRKSSGDSAPKLQISVPCRGQTRPDRSLVRPGLAELLREFPSCNCMGNLL